MTVKAAFGACLGGDIFPVGLLRDFCRYDPCGDGDDGVTHDHNDGGEGLAEVGSRGDVTVPDGCERYDGPVDAAGYAGKTVFLSFDNIHERSHDDDDGHDGEDENGDLPSACLERLHEELCLAKMMGELEDTEYAEHTEDADYCEVVSWGKEEAQICGKNCEEIDYAEKAGCVF